MPAITFDLWHTLMYIEPDAEESYMTAQMDLAMEVLAGSKVNPGSVTRSRQELRGIFESVYAEAVRAAQEGRSVSPATQLTRAAARAGREARPTEYLEGLHRLVAATPFLPAPGGREVLRYLRARGFKTAIISNTVGEPGDSLAPALRAMGLEPLIDTYVFSDRLPWTKPAPQIFQRALHDLNVPPSEAVHVGDGWADVEGARRAKLRAGVLFTGLQRYGKRYHELFLPPGWDRPPAEHRISRYEELPPLIDALFGLRPAG